MLFVTNRCARCTIEMSINGMGFGAQAGGQALALVDTAVNVDESNGA